MPIDNSTELFKKYRPSTFKQVIGQEEAVNQLKGMFLKNKVPHTILLSGNSGVGKTTIARIIAAKLNCGAHDLREINAASSNSVDDIRAIESKMRSAAITGDVRVWIIDESQRLSPQAQEAFLKPLEDTHKHVYFILCTTNPGKLIDTIHTRSTHIKLKLLTPTHLETLLKSVCEKEKFELPTDVCDKIINMSGGKARQALVYLHQVIELKSEQDMLDALVPEESEKKAGDLWGALVKFKPKWNAVAEVLEKIDEEPETIRRIILAIASKVMMTNIKLGPKAYLIANAFSENFYDSGKAGLVKACYELTHGM